MFAVSASPVAPLRAGARPPRRARPASARALFTKEKAKPVATTTGKTLSQDESMKEMSSIVAQAFGLGISLPVGVVGLMEASKSVAPDQDVGLYGFRAGARVRGVVGRQVRGEGQTQGGARGEGA